MFVPNDEDTPDLAIMVGVILQALNLGMLSSLVQGYNHYKCFLDWII